MAWISDAAYNAAYNAYNSVTTSAYSAYESLIPLVTPVQFGTKTYKFCEAGYEIYSDRDLSKAEIADAIANAVFMTAQGVEACASKEDKPKLILLTAGAEAVTVITKKIKSGEKYESYVVKDAAWKIVKKAAPRVGELVDYCTQSKGIFTLMGHLVSFGGIDHLGGRVVGWFTYTPRQIQRLTLQTAD